MRYLCVLLLACLALPARAATMYFLSDVQLTRMATAVVVGRVLEVSAFVLPNRPRVQTRVRIEVDDYVKSPWGEPPREIEVMVPGGATPTLVTQRPGVPRFAKDEKVLLFLELEAGELHVLAMSRGKYRVLPGEGGDAETVRLELDGLTQLDPETGREIPADLIPAAAGRVYLADMVATLRASLAAMPVSAP